MGQRRTCQVVLRANSRLVTGTPPDIDQRTRDRLALYLRENSVAASSVRVYSRAFQYWKRWTSQLNIAWQLRLAQEEQVRVISNFIMDACAHGFGSGMPVQSSTIRAALCGIRHFFLAAGLEFPSSNPQVRMLLRGVGKRDLPPRQKAPISIALLEECLHDLDFHDPADQALWGVLCLAVFFVLRRSEIVATTATTFRWFALKASDIAVIDSAGTPTAEPKLAAAVCIRLRGSKTNQRGSPVTRMLTRPGHPNLCPVLGALLLIRARGNLTASIPAAVFLSRAQRPCCVTAARVAQVIQAAARRRGEDPRQFRTHSLRAGGATNMYRAGVDALTIQFHGRWASDAFKLYTRLCNESVATVTERMVSGATASTTLR
jgi:integrase